MFFFFPPVTIFNLKSIIFSFNQSAALNKESKVLKNQSDELLNCVFFFFLPIISSFHLEPPRSCSESERLEPQLSVEWGHLPHHSMSLFSEASFDVSGERFASETALLCGKMPCTQKQTLIHVYSVTAIDSFSAFCLALFTQPDSVKSAP